MSQLIIPAKFPIMTNLFSPLSHKVCDFLGLERNKYGLVPNSADLLHKYTDLCPVDQSIINRDTHCYFNFYTNVKRRPTLQLQISSDPVRLALYECRFAQGSPLPKHIWERLPMDKVLEYQISLLKNNELPYSQ